MVSETNKQKGAATTSKLQQLFRTSPSTGIASTSVPLIALLMFVYKKKDRIRNIISRDQTHNRLEHIYEQNEEVDDGLTDAVTGNAADRAANAARTALALVLLGLFQSAPATDDVVSSAVPLSTPLTAAPPTTVVLASASAPPPVPPPTSAAVLPPELLALLARLGITTTSAAPTQDAVAPPPPPPALDAEAVATLHSQAVAVLNVKALVPVTLDLNSDNYSRWRGLFLVALGKYALQDHVFSDVPRADQAD
ncbi:hypothetical protein OsJ_23758 [Oryza sativa Japonica Group]|uniref:Uncharacterized protein n=1 Tax=Oryza sativa subsp. japonica TaxID=39947 RepID=B9FWH4_ORYSJ|nr:hypothetical protein OsJ_23758 [Oryza sativa Japonica Group]